MFERRNTLDTRIGHGTNTTDYFVPALSGPFVRGGVWLNNCRCLVRRIRRRLQRRPCLPLHRPSPSIHLTPSPPTRAWSSTSRRVRCPSHSPTASRKPLLTRHRSGPRSWSTLVTVPPRAISSTLRLSWATCRATTPSTPRALKPSRPSSANRSLPPRLPVSHAG